MGVRTALREERENNKARQRKKRTDQPLDVGGGVIVFLPRLKATFQPVGMPSWRSFGRETHFAGSAIFPLAGGRLFIARKSGQYRRTLIGTMHHRPTAPGSVFWTQTYRGSYGVWLNWHFDQSSSNARKPCVRQSDHAVPRDCRRRHTPLGPEDQSLTAQGVTPAAAERVEVQDKAEVDTAANLAPHCRYPCRNPRRPSYLSCFVQS